MHIRDVLMWLGAVPVAMALIGSARAEPTYLFGKIGNHPVSMSVNRKGDELSGWYFYPSLAHLIQLEGKVGSDGSFQMDEKVDFKTTGQFEGGVHDGHWAGNWRKTPDAAPMAFDLQEIHGQYDRLQGSYDCSLKEHDTQFGYSYQRTLKLSIADAKVRSFTAMQKAYTDDRSDEQACTADLKYMRQVSSKSGLLLATKEADGQTDGNVCTIRFVGDAETLWIHFVDVTADGDPCKGDDYMMYCAPRAAWKDIVINRRSGKCKVLD